MVTLAKSLAAGPVSTPRSSARPADAAGPSASLLRMGLAGRLAIAGAAVLLIWSAIAVGLA